jgi:hypothetical protein
MRTIIAGSRTLDDPEPLLLALDNCPWEITTIISGKAKGADTIGEAYAEAFGLSVLGFPADWDKYGKKAGHIRNEEMAKVAQACIVIWDGTSPGSKNMISLAKTYGLPLMIYNYTTNSYLTFNLDTLR